MHPTPPVATIDSLAGYLYRRRRSAHALSTGEAATVAIAAVRGCAASPSRAATGEWRLTAEGRPVLVSQPDGEDVLTATVAILDEVVALVGADVRPGFARLRDGVLTEPPPAWTALEKRLLAVVDPQPLVLGPLAPVDTLLPPPPSDSLADAAPDRFLDRLRAAAGRVRPRVLLTGVGVAVALAVATVALMPPGGPALTSSPLSTAEPGAGVSLSRPQPAKTLDAPASASNDEGPTDDSAESVEDTRDEPSGERHDETQPETATTAPGGDDTLAAATASLHALAACADDVCASRFHEAADTRSLSRPMDPAITDVEMIDDFGGMIVVRLTGTDRSQYVTLVRQQDRWLVRSVRDVADQPS